MNNVVKLGALRGRSMSMQEYDEPKLNRRARQLSGEQQEQHGRFSVAGSPPSLGIDIGAREASSALPPSPTSSPCGSPPHKVHLDTIDESGASHHAPVES